MPVSPKPAVPSAPRSPSPWRDIRLDDARRQEERSPDQIIALPRGRGWLDVVLLAGATVVLIGGLHLLAPGTSQPVQEAAAAQAPTRAN
jgi:hypothetical protein